MFLFSFLLTKVYSQSVLARLIPLAPRCVDTSQPATISPRRVQPVENAQESSSVSWATGKFFFFFPFSFHFNYKHFEIPLGIYDAPAAPLVREPEVGVVQGPKKRTLGISYIFPFRHLRDFRF